MQTPGAADLGWSNSQWRLQFCSVAGRAYSVSVAGDGDVERCGGGEWSQYAQVPSHHRARTGAADRAIYHSGIQRLHAK